MKYTPILGKSLENNQWHFLIYDDKVRCLNLFLLHTKVLGIFNERFRTSSNKERGLLLTVRVFKGQKTNKKD